MNESGKFKDVDGFIAEDERIALQTCVLATSNVAGDALEIGSLNGLSALLTLTVLHSKKILFCIDLNPLDKAAENITRFWQLERVIPICQNFNNLPVVDGQKFSFIFIDHSHTFEDTMAAFDKYWPVLSDGGIFSFHDYEHVDYQGGTDAINKILKDNNLTIWLRAGGYVAIRK